MALTKVTGHVIKSDTNITSHNINSSVIVTAITFDGNFTGVAVTFTGDSTIGSLGITTNLNIGGISTFTGNIDANGDIDVDGHTNLDNVNISGVTTTTDSIHIKADNKFLLIGQSNDLSLAHTAGHSYIADTGTGGLYLTGSNVRIQNATQNEDIAVFNQNDSVDLYFNNTKRFETTNTGAVVSGILTVTGNMNVEGVLTYQDVTNIDSIGIVTARAGIVAQDDVTFQTANGSNIFIDKSDNSIRLGDSVTQYLGSDNDLWFLHNGSTGYIHNVTGSLYIRNESAGDIYIQGKSGENSIICNDDGAVELYHNNIKKAETSTQGLLIPNTLGVSFGDAGCKVTGTAGSGGSAGLFFMTNSGGKWQITGDGHILPSAVGSYNIGSATAEIGHVFLADDKQVLLGNSQDLKIYHSSSDNHSYITESGSGDLLIKATQIKLQDASGSDYLRGFTGGAVYLHNAGATKFETTSTGVHVTGEVAATQDYPNIRPVLDFNFAATKKLKPEMTFARVGEASFHDGVGSVKFVSDNEPRFEHDIVTGECKGLMFEGAGTNYSWYSRFFKSSGYSTGSWVPINGGATPTITENTHIAPDGTSSGLYMADTITGATGTTNTGNIVRQQWTAGTSVKHTVSIYVKLLTATQATIYIRDANTGSTQTASAIPNTRNWQRLVVTTTNAMTASVTHTWFIGNTNGTIAVWGSQIERSDYVSSYIKTTGGANGTRNTDKGVHLDGEDVTDVFNQGEGTLIAEAILTQSVGNNPIVGFYEDLGSNNRLELRGDASSVGGARFEAVVGGSTVTSLTTGLTHSGVNNVSKYAYAFQENNYAGCVNGGSVTTDSSSTFPHGTGIDSMMIGEAVYNVDAAVIVKRIMYYADRLPNSQLVTLTS